MLSNRRAVWGLFSGYLVWVIALKLIWGAIRGNLDLYKKYMLAVVPHWESQVGYGTIPPAWHWAIDAIMLTAPYEVSCVALFGLLCAVLLFREVKGEVL